MSTLDLNQNPAAVLDDAPPALGGARLPAWALPADWPRSQGLPVLADMLLEGGRITAVRPQGSAPLPPGAWALGGAPVLPGLVDAHTHLDKAFTLPRMGQVQPGLLGAIEAMMADRAHWTPQDVHQRANQGLQWAHAAGVVQLRSHCDWWEPEVTPVAWPVLRELAARIRAEGGSVLATTSRRTPRPVTQALLHAFDDVPGVIWSDGGDGSNPYADLLASPRYRAATRFFLDELYGPQEFGDRANQ